MLLFHKPFNLASVERSSLYPFLIPALSFASFLVV